MKYFVPAAPNAYMTAIFYQFDKEDKEPSIEKNIWVERVPIIAWEIEPLSDEDVYDYIVKPVLFEYSSNAHYLMAGMDGKSLIERDSGTYKNLDEAMQYVLDHEWKIHKFRLAHAAS
jgi:hypothetical protein